VNLCLAKEGRSCMWGLRGKRKPKGKKLESERRECWCCGRVSVRVQWLRWRNGGALVGGWLREEKELER